MIPGETIVRDGDLELAPGRERRTLRVDNRGDRPIQVGSHAHLFEVNRALTFERERAYGFRLDVPAGTAVRFEPGEGREVEIVALAGGRRAFGLAGLVSGSLEERREAAFAAARERGYLEATAEGADDADGGDTHDGEART
jgi:urease subunit beta